MSLFITFEGGEGSGKSTQARALYRHLSRLGIPAIYTHEPGGTALGDRIDRWVKHGGSTSSEAEMLLFAASRAQLIDEVIRPSLSEGKVVICDRYSESTLSYQGYGRGLSLNTINSINSFATGGMRSDLIVLLDIDPRLGLVRKNPEGSDRFEREVLAFHQRVRDGYLQMANTEPHLWLVIDATQPRVEITHIIWRRVEALLNAERKKP